MTRRQVEMPIPRSVHEDRNASLGGKSFYFFDLDENVFRVESAHYLFSKTNGERVEVPGKDFWSEYENIGVSGTYKDLEVREEGLDGSFQRFRDCDQTPMEEQAFIQDIKKALSEGTWQGPAWNHFHHAVLNQRPISVITARGHKPETIKAGLDLFGQMGFLPTVPNYLEVLPVSNPEIRKMLGGVQVPDLKRLALQYAVESAFERYGRSDYHRFGMSDDDPRNIKKIVQAFIDLKKQYPRNAFFVVETSKGRCHKWEIFEDHAEKKLIPREEQLSLFNSCPVPEESF